MKVAIIAFSNLKFSPYIFPYVEMLKNYAHIDLIYLNRNNIHEEFLDGKLIEIKWNSAKNKILNFLEFGKQVSKILKRESYDFVVVLTTFPAVLLSNVLKTRYKGRYLVDVRDYTHEDNPLYYYFEKKALKHAAFRIISAPGFESFLPKYEYFVYQNISLKYRNGLKSFNSKSNDKIIIGYVGSIAYKKQCMKLIDLIKNDERFCFYFYGNESGDNSITKYVSECNCDRIKSFGEYMPSEKEVIIEGVDILFNIYGNDCPLVRYALSNKLYDSMYFKKPLLVSPGTDMQKQSQGFSYPMDLERVNNLVGLYNWYINLDLEKYEQYANNYIEKVFERNDEFESKLLDFLRN